MPILGNDLLKRGGVGAPALITMVSGSPQSANCGATYTLPLIAIVVDATLHPVPNVSVTFTAPASGASGTFASTSTRTETVVTGADGKATSSAFTANGTGDASAYNVVASAGALSCNFALTNNWTWFYYNTSLALPAWWRMRDTSGVTVVNSGSLGSALDLTATAWTMAQAGQLGAGEAGLADGATTILTTANNATLAGYTLIELGFLVKPSSAGEANYGTFASWGNGTAGDHVPLEFNNGLSLIAAHFNTALTKFVTTTTTVLSTTAWSLVFVALESDRKAHIRIGSGGVVAEASYSAQQAMTGTMFVPTNAFNLFNVTTQTYTFAGLCDEVFVIGGRTFTAAERLQMTVLAGV